MFHRTSLSDDSSLSPALELRDVHCYPPTLQDFLWDASDVVSADKTLERMNIFFCLSQAMEARLIGGYLSKNFSLSRSRVFSPRELSSCSGSSLSLSVLVSGYRPHSITDPLKTLVFIGVLNKYVGYVRSAGTKSVVIFARQGNSDVYPTLRVSSVL